MNVTTICLTIALVVFVLAKRIRGQAVPTPRKLLLLPLVVSLLGVQNVSHAKTNAVDVAVVVAGAAISFALGLLRGRMDRLTTVNGSPWMSWSTASVVILVVNVVAKLALDAGGVLAGGTSAALSSSILLSLGLTLLGEAVMIWLRTDTSLTGAMRSARHHGGIVRGSGGPTGRRPLG
jgi:hypothetical protein